MEKKIIAGEYGLKDFQAECYENTIFVACNFAHAHFGESQWKNCLFIDCNFSLGTFWKSLWLRCSFKTSEFLGVHLDHATFEECNAYMCAFDGAKFNQSKFDFNNTDRCDFSQAKFTHYEGLPGECREIVGELIRQSGEEPEIIAFAGLVKTCREFCWESIMKIGSGFLSKEGYSKIEKILKKFPNFSVLLERYDRR